MSERPVLYSFRRCPYAIRARMALKQAGVPVELREVLLKDKPAEMLAASPKGTVPVLVLGNGEVIDESLDVMHWALRQCDPDGWLQAGKCASGSALIDDNDTRFKPWLDRYKYADRHPEQPSEFYRAHCERFIGQLEDTLCASPWLAGRELGFVDVAIFPFIRQFVMVDQPWFAQAPYIAVRGWLQRLLESPLFAAVMKKYPRWSSGAPASQFP